MYPLARKSGHTIWKEQWYALTSKVSLQGDLYMTQEDWVFVANVVVINSTQEMVASSVINQPTCVVVEL